ncbi:phosphate regulon transcriptional regulator PhoB [Gimibacter soli]|uniref:Phosphate regulon transcriptional regulatory protein PhoB n=1 Tax=Gimibacter soli TaxID=3024400 RepID=A0AAE9XMZ3_9PROT|nr:phosphate regulon transcriptional regulator PhoB [Gimibacter soli]WCL53017.1 phosphate regulon transcriptional regulator PhoB [Gimibacter soli]
MKTKILLIEDDENISELVKYNLTRAEFSVITAADGEEGLLLATEESPDLILLDWMLPNLSGLEICRRLRRNNSTAHTPILMLTARADEPDRIRGLETGADDYITKPFSPKELVARIQAVLRRVRPALAAEQLRFKDIILDNVSHQVTRAEKPVHLGPTEYRLLRHFMENPGRVFSREQLLDSVWGYDVYVEPRTVDVHIRRLRKAINGDTLPDYIRTVRSAGYALDTTNAI